MNDNELDAILEQFTQARNNLTLTIKKLRDEKRRRGLPTTKRPGFGTMKMIRTADLKPYIITWLENYARTYNGRSGVRTLAEKAKVSHATVDNIRGKTNHKDRPQEYLRIDTADKLCSALEIPHIFHSLEIVEIPWGSDKTTTGPIIPNPPFSHCDD